MCVCVCVRARVHVYCIQCVYKHTKNNVLLALYTLL